MTDVKKHGRSLTEPEINLFHLIKGDLMINGHDRRRDIHGLRTLLLSQRPSRHKFNVNCCNEYGHTPLMLAISYYEHDEEQQFGVSDEEERSIFEVVSILLEHGADVNIQKYEGELLGFTALHFASRYSYKIVKLLLSHGADPNLSSYEDNDYDDNDNVTPLCIASRNVNYLAMKVLLESGADPNHKNDDGNTPIHMIFLNVHQCSLNLATPALQLLLQYGADVNTSNVYGSTSLHIAIGKKIRIHEDFTLSYVC